MENSNITNPVVSDCIVSGTFYEITENNFQEEFEYSFTAEDILLLNQVLSSESYTTTRVAALPEMRYLMFLTDASGNDLYEFGVDADGNLYDENDNLLVSDKLTPMMKSIMELANK